jgi:hypothetical protein
MQAGAYANRPGLIALFGSGETSSSGRKVHDYLFQRLPTPVKVAILETPAGFQPNSDVVAGKIKQFLEHSLQNFRPEVEVIAARKKGTSLSPDNPNIVDPISSADYIFAGPGSPSYTTRQLEGSLAYRLALERHAAGATLSLASAAAIAFGAWTLPVYEIFKVGSELHWLPGLGLFAPYGLDLAIVTHWNNREGGKELDTSHCYMGAERFARLKAMLPTSTVVLGVDEHTAVIFDLAAGQCSVLGVGSVTIERGASSSEFPSGVSFPLDELRS